MVFYEIVIKAKRIRKTLAQHNILTYFLMHFSFIMSCGCDSSLEGSNAFISLSKVQLLLLHRIILTPFSSSLHIQCVLRFKEGVKICLHQSKLFNTSDFQHLDPQMGPNRRYTGIGPKSKISNSQMIDVLMHTRAC